MEGKRVAWSMHQVEISAWDTGQAGVEFLPTWTAAPTLDAEVQLLVPTCHFIC